MAANIACERRPWFPKLTYINPAERDRARLQQLMRDFIRYVRARQAGGRAMRASRSPQVVGRENASKLAPQFRQPDDCPVAMCPTVVMYEQELERHRATETRLRQSVLREGDLLRQKDELIRQKDVLAKESEHRFLNGLQLVNSLLQAQSRSIENPEAAAQLTTAAKRVATLGQVHRHLHVLDTLESVEFSRYLEELCRDLSNVASGEFAERSVSFEGVELEIPRVTAVPLGFIASELITNSIKYAKGRIAVSLQTTPNGDAVLSVSDDGPGLPDGFDPAATSGLGMKIITALVGQIHGVLNFTRGDHDQGTRFSVLFNPGGGDRSRSIGTSIRTPIQEGRMVDKNRIIGSAKKAKGTVRQVIGKVTGDAKLEAEGTAEKAEGSVQNAIGGLKDAVKGR